MDIKRKCFEESNNVNPDWSFKFDEELQQYIALDSEMELQVDEFNEHWDTFRAGWEAKAQAVPGGFVLVPKDRLAKAVDGIEALFEEDCTLALGQLLPIQQDLNAMIEAQEPAND